MTLTQTRIGLPLDEFLALAGDGSLEIIDGKRRFKLPPKAGHSDLTKFFYDLLLDFLRSLGYGVVYAETTFVLPGDAHDPNWVTGSRVPDVMVFLGTRIADYKRDNPDWRDRPLALIPDFVIEIVSPNDKATELDEKIDAYLSDGVRLIWVIYPSSQKAIAYAPDWEQPRHYAGEAVLRADDVLPDFGVKLSDVFA
jgi:Uma2 family endonuclease